MKKFLVLFKKVKGKEVLRQYAQGHVLFTALSATLLLGFSKKALEIVRLCTHYKLLKRLRKKTAGFVENWKQNNSSRYSDKHEKIIWMCWLQGIETAPELVRACAASVQKHLEPLGYKVVFLNEKNLHEYVTMPDYIEEKKKKDLISGAHYADLIRLNVLLEHGGTWIDSTVFCSSSNVPAYQLESPLFVYQILKPGLDGHSLPMSNWFITANAGHPILKLTRDLLYDYWKNNDKLVDYFIFHYYFEIACQAFPELSATMVPCSSETPHILLLHLFEQSSEKWMDAVLSQSCFHKLTYKFTPEQTALPGTNYQALLERMKQNGLSDAEI